MFHPSNRSLAYAATVLVMLAVNISSQPVAAQGPKARQPRAGRSALDPGRLVERIWEDGSGQFAVEAALITVDDKQVTLLRSDNGKEGSLPLAKLSKADQEFVKEFTRHDTRQAQARRRQQAAQAADLAKQLSEEDYQEIKRMGQRAKSLSNLKSIMVALHGYQAKYGHFPTKALVGTEKTGQARSASSKESAGLSWRVAILPFLEEHRLYSEFHLDEPWDSPHNLKLVNNMPRVYRTPGAKIKKGITNYLAVVGEQSVIVDGTTGAALRSVIDGMSNTIVVVEANNDRAVTWTQPEDYELGTIEAGQGLGDMRSHGILSAFADGSILSVPNSVSPETLKAMFTRNGREPVDARRVVLGAEE